MSFVGGVVVRSKERSEIRHTLQRFRASVLTLGYGTEPSRVDTPAWRSLHTLDVKGQGLAGVQGLVVEQELVGQTQVGHTGTGASGAGGCMEGTATGGVVGVIEAGR